MLRLLKVLAILLLLAALALSALGWWAWPRIFEPYPASVRAPVVVELASGQSASSFLTTLEQRGLLRDARLTRLYLIHWLGDPPLQAGEYQFDRPLDAPGVLAKLVRGEVMTRPVTVIEGLTYLESAAAIAAAGFADQASLLAEMRKPERVADLDPRATNLEGYLYPDTYRFARSASAKTIVDAMVANFRRHHERELLPVLAGSGTELGLRELVVLASIVEKETQKDDERTLVASVYANRLRRGIGLYADPTIIYALKIDGRWDGNLRKPDLQLDSPYNTYVRLGLPPGPICSPSIRSLLAAAQPADSAYLYFVSRNDGTHVFAETLGEHNRNVEIWQRRYWRERWARERNIDPEGADRR